MAGATLPTGAYSAVYYPWIYISDPAPDAVRGGIKKVPPGASVVGMILRTDYFARSLQGSGWDRRHAGRSGRLRASTDQRSVGLAGST